MPTIYQYNPQEDLTVLELSAIMKVLLVNSVGGSAIDKSMFEMMPVETKRHFKAIHMYGGSSDEPYGVGPD